MNETRGWKWRPWKHLVGIAFRDRFSSVIVGTRFSEKTKPPRRGVAFGGLGRLLPAWHR
jgi:hypothetical protein